MFINKERILFSNKISLEIKNKRISGDSLYGSETWTLGKNEERVVNAFETWCCGGMLKIKRKDGKLPTNQTIEG
jgi:hypothetical protein